MIAFSFKERVLIGLLAILLIGGAGLVVFRGSIDDSNRRLHGRAELISHRLTDRFGSASAVLTTLSALNQASERLDSSQLTSIVEQLLERYEHVSAIGYLSRVPDADRENFERSMEREGFHGFKIREPPSTTGKLAIAGRRAEYWPLHFLEPLEPETARFLGMDIRAHPGAAPAVRSAIASGDVSMVPLGLFAPENAEYLLAKATYFGLFPPATEVERDRQGSGAFVLSIDIHGMLTDIITDFPDILVTLRRDAAEGNTASPAFAISTGTAEASTWLGAAIPRIQVSRTLTLQGDSLAMQVAMMPRLRDSGLLPALVAMLMSLFVVSSSVNALRNRRISRLQKQLAQSELARERERAQVTLQSITDGVVTTDSKLQVQYLNPEAETLTGWTLREGKDHALQQVVMLIDEVSREPLLTRDVPYTPAQALPESTEAILRTRNSGEIPVSVSHAVLRSQSGVVEGFVYTLKDITERKEAEEKSRRAKNEAERATTQLKAAQGELVRKERLATLGQVAATISHELRNPLGTLRNVTSILKDLAVKEEAPPLDLVEMADRTVTRCDTIITDLLEFARVQDVARSAQAIDGWLEILLEGYQHAPGITLCQGERSGAEVAFDPDRLRRAMLNVLDNACQAIEEGLTFDAGSSGGKVTVSTRVASERVEVVVEDTGSGIAAAVMGSIFEPLFTTKSFGVGLGLPAVKQIMEQHGGGVEVESGRGSGARVVLWLPRHPDEQKGAS